MSEERLQKVLARAGVGSRRACEKIITAGRVTVDGRVVTELGTKVDPETASIHVDGQPIAGELHRYIMLHKPAGYLSGLDRRAGYPSWLDLVKVPERLYAVGRLDVDSEGLLLLTNDGELAQRLTHPRYQHPKTYLVQVEGVPSQRKIRRLQHGVMLRDGRTAPADVTLLRRPPALLVGKTASEIKPGSRPKRTSWLKVTLREGRKRQLRRMVGLLGHPALRVIRIGLGPLNLTKLPSGKWRDLKPGEVRALHKKVLPTGKRIVQQRNVSREKRKATPERKSASAMPNIIAIDGPAASGKSTIGQMLARELGYLYFDTGVMYRAITWVALARGVPIENEKAVTALAKRVKLEVLAPTVDDGRDVTVLADGKDITWDIRRPEVERSVSPVAAYPGVRQELTRQQRRIGQTGQVVMVGRDIGTVVLPEADLKIYLDASVRERARRRYLERQARGEDVDFQKVLEEMKRRDFIDSNRQHAPLTAAPDAIVVDSTDLSIAEVMALVRGLVKRR